VRLIAVEDWGANVDRELQLGGKSPAILSALAPARYRVVAGGSQSSCYYTGEVLDLRTGPTSAVAVPVASAPALQGRLIGTAHNPADYLILIWPEMPVNTEPGYMMLTPDAEGIFRVEALRPGDYRILATSFSEWSASNWKPDPRRFVHLQLTQGLTDFELPFPN